MYVVLGPLTPMVWASIQDVAAVLARRLQWVAQDSLSCRKEWPAHYYLQGEEEYTFHVVIE